MKDTYDIFTIHGEIEVTVETINENNFELKSETFFDEYILVKGFDIYANKKYEFVELRTKIGYVLLNVFDGTIDNENISKITNWIIENNN